jgi:hypothetical protein
MLCLELANFHDTIYAAVLNAHARGRNPENKSAKSSLRPLNEAHPESQQQAP